MPNEWGYSQCNGPKTWPVVFPDAAGKRQSPIDISPVNLKQLITTEKLNYKYVAENTRTLTNTGCSWKVLVNGEGSELSGGPLEGKYILEQFHCHWGATDNEGSEHTIGGKSFAGELHLVHWDSIKYSSLKEAAKHPDGLCVLAVFLKLGEKHSELNKVITELAKVEYKHQRTDITSPIDPTFLIPSNSGYYTYQGSLTTPPCSECVIWIVFKEPISVSEEQLTAFRNLKSYGLSEDCPIYDDFHGFLQNNFRPTVPLGQREIRECQ